MTLSHPSLSCNLRDLNADFQNPGAALLETLVHGPQVITLRWAVVQQGNLVPDLLIGRSIIRV